MWKIRRFILSLFLRLPSRRHIRHIKYIKFDIVLSPLNETINYISKKKAKMVPPRSPFTDAIDNGMSDKVVKPKIKKHKLPLLGYHGMLPLLSSPRFDTSIARTQQKKVSRTKFYTFRITSFHVYDSLSPPHIINELCPRRLQRAEVCVHRQDIDTFEAVSVVCA